MSRPPEVFVRPVSMTEGQRLQRIGRTAKDPVKLRRAIVVLMSAQGQSAPDIAHLLDCSQEYVRQVIHDFNDIGFKALDPKWSGGRPKAIGEQARRQIRVIARCCPRDLGPPFSAWSLSKLAEHLVAVGHNIALVYLPTSASWLNWIEAEFAALRYFALNGTDHRSHAEQAQAIAGYVRWRNERARPKRNFAPDSVIRTWTDYQVNVAWPKALDPLLVSRGVNSLTV
jgi:transposase